MSALNEIRVILSVLELGSFTAAGARHRLTGSAAAKLLTRVEQRLGVKLLARSTRRLTLSPEGEAYLQRMRQVVADVDDLERELASSRATPKGPLKVTCPGFFFIHQLAPHLPDFLERHPEIDFKMTVSDRRLDLLSEGIDVAVRLGPLPDSSLAARKVCDLYRGLYAAPRYLRVYGLPERPEDLAHHQCLYSSTAPGLDEWPFRGEDGKVRRLKVSNRLELNDNEAVFRAALAGLGIVQISDLLSPGPALRGELVPVLEEHYDSSAIPLWLVMPPGRQRAARVSVFIDFFLERFAHAPWRSGVAAGPPPRAGRAKKGSTKGAAA
jgi:DNA-binding transcriptional LysR family regulator